MLDVGHSTPGILHHGMAANFPLPHMVPNWCSILKSKKPFLKTINIASVFSNFRLGWTFMYIKVLAWLVFGGMPNRNGIFSHTRITFRKTRCSFCDKYHFRSKAWGNSRFLSPVGEENFSFYPSRFFGQYDHQINIGKINKRKQKNTSLCVQGLNKNEDKRYIHVTEAYITSWAKERA